MIGIETESTHDDAPARSQPESVRDTIACSIKEVRAGTQEDKRASLPPKDTSRLIPLRC